MTQSRGILYQATGQRRYLASCACSVQSLRDSGYDGPIRVLVDTSDIPNSLFEGLNVDLHVVDAPSSGAISARWIKTQLHLYSPWDHTLFLDSDIVVLNDISSLWHEAEDADLAMVRCLLPVEKTMHGLKQEVEFMRAQSFSGPQWNGGVMLWRCNEKTQRLFQLWNEEWQRFGHIDQLALVRALREIPLRFHELPLRYNCLYSGAILQRKHEGIVFWHLGGGRDTYEFPALFGEIYQSHCRALGLKKNDMDSPYHATLRWRLRIYFAMSWLKGKFRGAKRRGQKLLLRR